MQGVEIMTDIKDITAERIAKILLAAMGEMEKPRESTAREVTLALKLLEQAADENLKYMRRNISK